MDNKNEMKSATNEQSGKSSDYRRKRVNRIKTIIVIIVILLLLLPTILCIILGIQVHRLQMQMKDLVELHSEYGITYEDENYAYAAELSTEDSVDDSLSKESKEENNSAEMTENISSDDVNNNHAELTENNSARDTENNLARDIENNSVGENENNLAGENNPVGDTDNKLTTESTAGTISEPADIQAEESGAASSETENKPLDMASASEPEEQPTVGGVYAGKKVYLTFDDGPSIYTAEILDILEEWDVKATFFVVGKTDDTSKELYQRIVDEGHTLGIHSYSHQYEKIYNSLEDFEKDFTKLWKLLYDTTGYKPSIYRFPGGSDNLVSKNGVEDFIEFLNDNSIVYFDWNVVNGDATGVEYTKEQLIKNVLSGVAEKNTSIVLMHDSQSKKTTVDSLPGLLKKLTEGGAQMLPLDQDVTPIQMIKADSIK